MAGSQDGKAKTGGDMFYADLHIHSKYSRACSKNCDLEHLAWWAGRKGVTVVGTGDFTHPAWSEELRTKLVPAEPGLFRLRPELEQRVARTLPAACRTPVRFMFSVEISTIYKRDDRTRKVHHLIYAPDHDAAGRITTALAKIGNLAADGRPILGLDSRDLLEITLESDPASYLVPAHVWTPWFSVLGSKSGFDAVADCYADLAEHIFAIETGLSSDPPMNWRVSALDRYRLVSNSDAHSPPALAREASAFDTAIDYHAIRRALETGEGYAGTVEFFPEEGKYHHDGHRNCDVRLTPKETKARDGRCPTCGRPLTVGVLHRVDDLADRPEGHRPADAAGYRNLVPLPEIVSEITGVGPRSKTVTGRIADMVAKLGPELSILSDVPVEDIRAAGGELLAEAIHRLRRGEVIREAGYDGEYGVIRLFSPDELRGATGSAASRSAALFDLPEDASDEPARTGEPGEADRSGKPGEAGRTGKPGRSGAAGGRRRADTAPAPSPRAARSSPDASHAGEVPSPRRPTEGAAPPAEDDAATDEATGLLARLDPDQRAAARHPAGPLLIVAGPGTGKTRTLTHRLAHLVAERGVPAERCLAITFTRRAAAEMRERLTALLPEHAAGVTVTTFHGLGAIILRECRDRAGLGADFQIADEARRLEIATAVAGTEAAARRLLARMERVRADVGRVPAAVGEAADGAGEGDTDASGADLDDGRLAGLAADYERALRDHGLVDFTGLLTLPVRMLGEDADLAARYRERWPWIFVDEYQDVDETQYTLLRLLSDTDGNVTAIGDPDQAIYAFRGADVGFFLRFRTDFPTATEVRLTRNYRSTPTIVTGAVQAIAPATLVRDRALRTVGGAAGPAGPAGADAPIGVFAAADEHAEADFVARTIDELLGGASFHSLDSGRASGHAEGGLGFADFAVLYRTDAQTRPVIEALTRAGIPFQKRTHDRLAGRPGVSEIAYELRHHGSGTLRDRIRSATRALIDRADDEDREIELRTAGELLAPLADRCDEDLDLFLRELALGAEVDAYDPRADQVALLTLHAAKGLEFPVVFAIGCERGLLPLRLPGERRGDDAAAGSGSGAAVADEDAEERRLFFVGMTRAQSRLYLSYARSRTRYGAVRETGPSPFLRAIDDGLLQRLDGAEGGARRRPREHQLRLI